MQTLAILGSGDLGQQIAHYALSDNLYDKIAIIEKDSVVYPGSLIDVNSVINANTILNIGCTIAHDSVIGAHCFLSPRVAVAGFVNIEECCVLRIHSAINDLINIIADTQLGKHYKCYTIY